MSSLSIPTDLIQHLSDISGLEPSEAQKMALEVLHFFSVTLEQFIVQRHAELQHAGYRNKEIFNLIESEVNTRLFTVAPVTQRQIRRAIYG